MRVAGESRRLSCWPPTPTCTSPERTNGYPAILVRLAAIGEDELRELILDGWRIQAPKDLVKASEL